MNHYTSHFPDVLQAVKQSCEFEQMLADTSSAPTLPASTSLSEASGQPEHIYKQALIRWLNLPELTLKPSSISLDSSDAEQKRTLGACKDSWNEVKKDFGAVADELPDTTIEGMASRLAEQELLLTRFEGLLRYFHKVV